MNNTEDLNIEKEILPLFNYSLNMFTRKKILEILETPLLSTTEIINRQNILKSFTANSKILKDYSYTVLYLNEVYFFLSGEYIEDLSQQKFKYKLLFSKKEKLRYASKFNQMILFFHRLQSNYFSRLDLKQFPQEYKPNVKRILEFLSNFELHKYESLIRKGGLKDKHIISLTKKINELKSKELIVTFWEDLFLFEAYLSINIGILKNDFSFPKFNEKGIKLIELYHPLIDNAVKNDFETMSNVVVLNGPNMSGKSTFLKSVGLCIYFGHLGFPIPASFGEIPFFNNFSIQINRRDDILNGYSHFMTEVMNLKNVVKDASNEESCFAIFDELFSGTNVEDAFEICKTTINGLSKYSNSFFLISTHIQELKEVSNQQISNYYIDCKLIKDIPTFTYKLKKGWSEIKVGRILFEKEGLNTLLK
jgi:DNA mismatch repair protein MutS